MLRVARLPFLRRHAPRPIQLQPAEAEKYVYEPGKERSPIGLLVGWFIAPLIVILLLSASELPEKISRFTANLW